MRFLVMAVAVLALLAVPAQAQTIGSKRGHKGGGPAAAGKKPNADEKAYQEALKRIPDSKEKYDPWAVTRSPEAGKSSKSAR